MVKLFILCLQGLFIFSILYDLFVLLLYIVALVVVTHYGRLLSILAQSYIYIYIVSYSPAPSPS